MRGKVLQIVKYLSIYWLTVSYCHSESCQSQIVTWKLSLESNVATRKLHSESDNCWPWAKRKALDVIKAENMTWFIYLCNKTILLQQNMYLFINASKQDLFIYW